MKNVIALNDLSLCNRLGEQWRNIIGYDGLFQVSNCGRVKRLAYTTKKGIIKPEKIVKQYIQRKKYAYVNLIYNCKQDVVLVSQLVATAFLDKKDGSVIHIDGDTLNNNASNLIYKGYIGVTHNTNTKNKPVIMLDIYGNKLAEFTSIYIAAKLIVCSKSKTKAIRQCCQGKTCTAFKYRWMFAK